MKAIRVRFANGNSIETNINGTDDEIRAYYLGNDFNLGRGEEDLVTRAISVEFLVD